MLVFLKNKLSLTFLLTLYMTSVGSLSTADLPCDSKNDADKKLQRRFTSADFKSPEQEMMNQSSFLVSLPVADYQLTQKEQETLYDHYMSDSIIKVPFNLCGCLDSQSTKEARILMADSLKGKASNAFYHNLLNQNKLKYSERLRESNITPSFEDH